MNLLLRICSNDIHWVHELSAHTTEVTGDGDIRETYLRFLDHGANQRVLMTVDRDRSFAVSKITAVFHNDSPNPVRLKQFDAGWSIPSDTLTLHYFTSDWGSEFFPHEKRMEGEFRFGSTSGRSCKGFDPWAGLSVPGGYLAVALAWSGSWNCTIAPEAGKHKFTMGFSTEDFYTDVAPGGSYESAALYLAEGADQEAACLEMRRYFRARLSLLNDGGIADVPLEYNEWWPYEDRFINEDVYQENAVIAKRLGCRYAMMDAGWFGGNENGQSWYEKRGDWEIVNKKDFPSGMKALCDKAKDAGILPGIWCEIEAVGKDAMLNKTHADLIAKRDGTSLGYVCFGNEAGRTWAMQVVDRILGEYGAKWIKFDFNLDPAPGCNASGHEHGPGDGLHAHYRGYYNLLDEIHRKYPDVVIENCSSGGLRMDVGMLSHTHWTHLSDPDYTEFHLQCFWGALSMLHQSACLHFSWSQILGDHNLGISDPIRADMPRHQFDFYIRAVLMGIPGFSYRLPELPEWCLDRLKEHGALYADIWEAFILNGDAYRLTPQPLMGGKGERFPAFQFSDASGNAVVFVFRLEGAPEAKTLHLKGLSDDTLYEVIYADSGHVESVPGHKLATDGITLTGLPEMGSEIVRICKVAHL